MSVSESPAPSPYEFTPEQDKAIGELGGQMRFVGIMTIVYAVVGLVSMVSAILTSGRLNIDFNPIVASFVGLWTISAGKSFQQVAQTQGHDITHLMTAIAKLRNVFGLFTAILYIALLFAVIIFIVALVRYAMG